LKRIEKLRCPLCNLKDFEIESRRRKTSARDRHEERIKPESIRKPSQISDELCSGADKTELWERERQRRKEKKEADRLKKLEQLGNRMLFHEQETEREEVTLNDFLF
jgi:excinuclease UvrABC helicase subunit UvrB